MGCPLLAYLPDLVDIAKHLQEWQEEPSVRKLLNYVCLACRAHSKDGQCPLGEPFGRELRKQLPFFNEVLEQELQR